MLRPVFLLTLLRKEGTAMFGKINSCRLISCSLCGSGQVCSLTRTFILSHDSLGPVWVLQATRGWKYVCDQASIQFKNKNPIKKLPLYFTSGTLGFTNSSKFGLYKFHIHPSLSPHLSVCLPLHLSLSYSLLFSLIL